MFHDMAFLSVLFGAVSEDYALENLTVGPRIGVNPGGCFVHDKRMNDCLPPILFSAIFKLLKVLPDTELDAC
jgi:hypothetical protein